MSLLQQANATLRLSGSTRPTSPAPPLGGLLVALTSPGWAIAVDAASYGVAALALSRRCACPPGLRVAGSTVLHELREGWHDFWSRTWLWAIVLQFSLVIAVDSGAIYVLGPEVANAYLGGAGACGRHRSPRRRSASCSPAW